MLALALVCCLFYTIKCYSFVAGRALIADTAVNDGAWHTAIVERRGRYVRLSLDGVYSAEVQLKETEVDKHNL